MSESESLPEEETVAVEDQPEELSSAEEVLEPEPEPEPELAADSELEAASGSETNSEEEAEKTP